MSVARLPGSRYLALAVLAMLPALALVAGDSRLPVPGYLPLHQVLEAVSIFVAFAVFATVWVVHTDRTPGSTLVVACALLAAGLLDVAHVLTFVGMPDLIAESGPQATLYFWLCARFAATAGLLVAALRPSLPFRRPQARYGVLAITLAGTLLLLWVGVRHVDALPLLFDEARGLTRTKVLAELSIIALLLTAAVLYRRRIGSDGSMDASGLFMASTVSILSGLCFVDYAQLTEPMTLIGHALKAIAYGYIFRAVFVSTVRAPVTHLREAQRSLEQRERQLRSSSRLAQATLDSLPEHVCVIDGNGVIVAVNRAWRQFALRNGTAPARVSEGVNYLAVCELAQGPGAEEARRLATEMRALLGGHAGTFRIEYPCHSLTEQRWFAMRANRFADTGETLVVVAHADITQNKLAETALRDNEARLAGIVGQAMDAVITVDESYRVVLFNQAAAAMFGCDPAEAIGRPVEDFVPERFRATHAGHTRDFALSGDSSTTMGRFGEIVALRANGEEIPVEASVSRVSVRGRLLFTVVMRDITERKRAQKAVLDAMARLEDAQRIGRIGDWTLEIATGAMTWSPQVFEMLELDPAAGVPTLASTMAHPGDDAAQDRRGCRQRASAGVRIAAASRRRPRRLSWRGRDAASRCRRLRPLARRHGPGHHRAQARRAGFAAADALPGPRCAVRALRARQHRPAAGIPARGGRGVRGPGSAVQQGPQAGARFPNADAGGGQRLGTGMGRPAAAEIRGRSAGLSARSRRACNRR
jgi:PAS domain S-box-containing protein